MRFVWLAELHRQWHAARGSRLALRERAFHRSWEDLMTAANIRSTEDKDAARREVEKLEKEGRLRLKRHKYRPYILEQVILPVESERWLRSVFESADPKDTLQQSLEHVRQAASWQHPLFPEMWRLWTEDMEKVFQRGGRFRPFSWRQPNAVQELLAVTFKISSKAWSGSFLREVSDGMGLHSKKLEEISRTVEACLSSLLGRKTTLEMLGIVGSQHRVEMAGTLTLHFPDGRMQFIDELNGCYHLTSDLLEAVSADTPARRVLTVENSKTTLRRIATLNADRSTLLVACAFPTAGLLRLLALLSADLPIYHFGDTDPAGYLILSKLRQSTARRVTPFLMHRREREHAAPLTDYDRAILPGLLQDPLLHDVRLHLEQTASSENKGNYEQESLGRPTVSGWPFFADYEKEMKEACIL